MRQESGEQVLGKCVHGNALPVDDLPQTTERTTWTHREREREEDIRTELSIISDCRVESGLMDRRLVSQ